ncbi:enoyl-CoA hydratase/isomerase family protein [Minwuia thermotolerans]|uniref:Enoyl-CoA hydratase n=1 Tax=Minwuia thermotolerans TaxID=2056226 RepID=A0A2M9G1F5_9PROT|nr:enoyl-CoA hydratase [Minwuia thermotolerans]PJK29529.1 enoyl-CoA hydratase [Minwuia thermotolerans]
MSYEHMTMDVSDGVALLRINRPDSANAIHLPLTEELVDAAIRCDEDPAIRAVVLTGEGKMFCAGGDIGFFVSQGEDRLPSVVKKMLLNLHGAISRLHRMDPPVVCAVNGTAAGAGFSLALQGDLVLAAESAKFTMAYTRVGLSPDGSSSYFLPRRVGSKRALDLILTNRLLTAAEALDWGIVDYLHPDDKLMDEAMKLAATLANGPTRAFGTAKRLIHESSTDSLESQMERETVGIVECMRTPDGKEGMDAFVNKRPAKFGG